MGRSTVHYADTETNNILKKLHNKLRPAGTPVQRVEYIIELLLLRIFEVKLTQDPEFAQLRAAFKDENESLLFSSLLGIPNEQVLPTLNTKLFPFYAHILSEARKVWKSNLSTKVQDQLVLIEEVFSNSNFSNNVTSGNMAEIIGLVAELDKDRLLKTDLLGDAIESALSETGGTKDIGLHRTPDHIRQFMVGLAAPTFDDKAFDPTVGTGGFMFDSFEYVMQGVSQDGHWPGPKSHPELAVWFKDWFAKHPVPMPSVEIATDFYRNGVGGIEYLGMVRKMAAINFYVRGLNPGNIQQGDALEKFGTEIMPKSKTVILANPPFGAERDKESYPNVWSEYPTESETTILFVKLMLESLKPGGRCAVIVSEGFLTWDQNSARALRRALLDECDLQAVISLPQGVFVSKNGQGAKTSILCFVKGGRTRNVWFYKVTNDGFTMGTNRKPLPGCQLVEALDLFHRFVREGKQPPESRHSFCIPADWIKVLDPRVKDKIREETRAEMSARAVEDKTKLTEKLDSQVAAKKLTATERKDRLAQHDELWRSKTENAIAQKFERAHLYSFNLSNYRSSLTPAQLAAWKDFAATYAREDDPSKTLEKQYRAIVATAPDELDELISGLDPRHTLELDIARQFLTGISDKLFTKHPHLRTLQDIIASQQKLPRVPLKELIEPRFEKIKKADYDGALPIVEKISFGDGKIHFREERKTGMDLYLVRKGDLLTSKINIHQGALALAPCDMVASTHYQAYLFRPSEAYPEFVVHSLRAPQFAALLNEQKNKGIKNEQGADFLGEFAIPLPDPTIQEATIKAITNSIKLREGVAFVREGLDLETDDDLGPTRPLDEAVLETKNGWSPNCNGGDTPVLALSCLKNGVIDLDEVKFTSESRPGIERFYVRLGDFFYSRGNTAVLVALAGIAHTVQRNVVFSDLLTRVRFNEDLLLPEFAVWLFNSSIGRKYFGAVPPGAAPSMVKVSQDYMAAFPVPLLGKLEKQREIIERGRVHRQSLEWLGKTALAQQERAAQILNRIWES
jgi:type I restriction-modification system DNA methylase subunit/restriction endonuclease S subunit